MVLIYSLDTTRQPRPGEINGKGERILIDKHGYSCKNKSKGSLWRPVFCYDLFLIYQLNNSWMEIHFTSAQPAFTCSKLAIETVEQGVKYVQS